MKIKKACFHGPRLETFQKYSDKMVEHKKAIAEEAKQFVRLCKGEIGNHDDCGCNLKSDCFWVMQREAYLQIIHDLEFKKE